MSEAGFAQKVLGDPASVWNRDALSSIADSGLPDSILGPNEALLRADIYIEWAGWFLEGIIDPRRYATRDATYPLIYGDVLRAIDDHFSGRLWLLVR